MWLKVNTVKTNVVHFRKKRSKTIFEFIFDNTVSNIVDRYKYIGTILNQGPIRRLNEHLDFSVTCSILSGAAGRKLGAVISKFKGLTNVGFNTFDKMCHTSVVPIIDYGSGIWAYKHFGEGDTIQFRTIRYFLWVHSKAPLLVLERDMGWISFQTFVKIGALIIKISYILLV